MPLDPLRTHPLRFADGSIHPDMVHLNRVIDHSNITIGDFTYANDFDPPPAPGHGWAARLAPYLYPGAPERLVIGRFCQIAHGVRFITASANHDMAGFSTYPFPVFDPGRIEGYKAAFAGLPDTVIGNDVWIGHGAVILPGAQIGDGVIVGAGAVVSGRVPPYAIVAGNPARLIRQRFAPDVTAVLLDLAWWNWPLDVIDMAAPHLMRGDLVALTRLRPANAPCEGP
ncbi:MAG: antibiotic acetyltransferase [Rhodobacterales bacterium]|nr:MAG: antibiotic acetyltransferase [Rhodobacterales bacterium]